MRAAGRCDGQTARTTETTLTRLSVDRVARLTVELPPVTQWFICAPPNNDLDVLGTVCPTHIHISRMH